MRSTCMSRFHSATTVPTVFFDCFCIRQMSQLQRSKVQHSGITQWFTRLILSRAEIGQHTGTPYINLNQKCGPMPNVMVALPNIGGALYSTPQSVADAHNYIPCSNAAKTRNQLKCGGVPQSNETISAASGPKFTILWGHLQDILLLNNFFRLSIRALVAKIQLDKVVGWCADGDFWRLFASCIFQRAACSTFQTCILNSHQGHAICRSMVDIQSPTAEIRRGK